MRRRILFSIVACLGIALQGVSLRAQNPPPILTVEGDHFAINGEPKFLLFASYFDAMRRANAGGANAGDIDTDLAYIKAKGYDGIRILPNWWADYCNLGPADADGLFSDTAVLPGVGDLRWQVFKRVLDRAAAHQLVVDVSFTRETITGLTIPEYQAQIVEVVSRLAGSYKHVLIDLQNEYTNNSLATSDVTNIRNAAKAVDITRILLASTGDIVSPFEHGVRTAQADLDVAAPHPARDPSLVWYQSETTREVIDDTKAGLGTQISPVYLQEPMPFRRHAVCGVPKGIVQTEDPNPSHAPIAALNAKRHGAAAWTFHTRQSFNLTNSRLIDIIASDSDQQASFEGVFSTAFQQQSWGACVYNVSTPAVTLSSTLATHGGAASVTVTSGCAWQATSSVDWLTVTASTTAGDGSVSIRPKANPSLFPRQATVTIAGKAVTVTQPGGRLARLIPNRQDFDNDGRTDIGVFRETDGQWNILRSSNGSVLNHQWGSTAASDEPVPGDYLPGPNGQPNGSELVVYRHTTAQWFILDPTTCTAGTPPACTVTTIAWGDPASNDIPVPADYDGDGLTDIAVFRPASGDWYIRKSSGGSLAVQWGSVEAGDIPVPADYDGDGQANIAVYRNVGTAGKWFIVGVGEILWGNPSLGDVPVPADYDGDMDVDVAVYRPSTATWYRPGASPVSWGQAGSPDVPVRGQFDTVPGIDLGVYRPGTAEWFINAVPPISGAFGSGPLKDVPIF